MDVDPAEGFSLRRRLGPLSAVLWQRASASLSCALISVPWEGVAQEELKTRGLQCQRAPLNHFKQSPLGDKL